MVLVVEHRSVHVEVPDCPALRLSSSFSVSTWVCLDTLSDVPGYQKEGGWPCILCKTRSWDNGFGFYGKRGNPQVPRNYFERFRSSTDAMARGF